MTGAEVHLWGSQIGAVLLEDGDPAATFDYTPEFAEGGVEVGPIQMPLSVTRYRFPALSDESFRGLPGLLADSLPDRYGHALINAWLARQGRTPESFNAVERLCYVGRRGMGALEFEPATGPNPTESHTLEVEKLADFAAQVLAKKEDLAVSLDDTDAEQAFQEILRVGTSAGGARAKALISLNPATMEVRSGQLDTEPDFEHWILKFDGIDEESREFGTTGGYGAIEFVYSRLAHEAGIKMAECRLYDEGGRRHFMTRRFDRGPGGKKLHMQSLAALDHLDYRLPGGNAYEQAFQVIRRLGLPMAATEQQFRRMVFNVVARNQDDHVKNIAFLMDRAGKWSLSPAFDLAYAHNPSGEWTTEHQMSINGKRDGFTMQDFRQVAEVTSMKRGRAETIVGEVIDAVRKWPELAAAEGIDDQRVSEIKTAHRLRFSSS